MSLDQVNPDPEPPILMKDDESTIYTTANTPSETTTADPMDDDDHRDWECEPRPPLLVPWPNSTFIIRSTISSGQQRAGDVITLLDGEIMLTTQLANISHDRSTHWVCIETNGWLGFRNASSGKLLGHDGNKGRLCCVAERHKEWEHFCVRMKPEGGCVLLVRHWGGLSHVGIVQLEGVEKLAKLVDRRSNDDEMVWEFVEV